MSMKINSEMCPEWADQDLPVCRPVTNESNRWNEENIKTLKRDQDKITKEEYNRFRRLCKTHGYEIPKVNKKNNSFTNKKIV